LTVWLVLYEGPCTHTSSQGLHHASLCGQYSTKARILTQACASLHILCRAHKHILCHTQACAYCAGHTHKLARTVPHEDTHKLAHTVPHEDTQALTVPHEDTQALTVPHEDTQALTVPHEQAHKLARTVPHKDTHAHNAAKPHASALRCPTSRTHVRFAMRWAGRPAAPAPSVRPLLTSRITQPCMCTCVCKVCCKAARIGLHDRGPISICRLPLGLWRHAFLPLHVLRPSSVAMPPGPPTPRPFLLAWSTNPLPFSCRMVLNPSPFPCHVYATLNHALLATAGRAWLAWRAPALCAVPVRPRPCPRTFTACAKAPWAISFPRLMTSTPFPPRRAAAEIQRKGCVRMRAQAVPRMSGLRVLRARVCRLSCT